MNLPVLYTDRHLKILFSDNQAGEDFEPCNKVVFFFKKIPFCRPPTSDG
jgi:hypothetical protein